MKFIITNKTTLLVKTAISLILISLISLSFASKSEEITSSLLFGKMRSSGPSPSAGKATNSSLQSAKRVPFKTIESEESVAAGYPVCNKKPILNMKVSWSADAIVKYIQNKLKKIKGKTFKTIYGIFNKYVWPFLKKTVMRRLMKNSWVMGDFSTAELKETGTAPDNAGCSNFPLAANKKANMSAIGFSVVGFPCLKPVDLKFCLIFDRCGTFGISVSGGIAACITTVATAGTGVAATPFIEAVEYGYFGVSIKRQFEQKMEFLDPQNDMKKRMITLRSHAYMGIKGSIPKLGVILPNGEDVTSIVALKVEGKAFLDLGDKAFNMEEMQKILKSKLPVLTKFGEMINVVREFSFQASGNLELKLEDITGGLLDDIKILDFATTNILVNFGENLRGSQGSSGLRPGFHFFYKPPGLHHQKDESKRHDLKKVFESLTNDAINIYSVDAKKQGKVFKIPTIPTFDESNYGISIGENIELSLESHVGGKEVFSLFCSISYEDLFLTNGRIALGPLLIHASLKIASSCRINLEPFINTVTELGKTTWNMSKKAFGEIQRTIGFITKTIKNTTKEDLKNIAALTLKFTKKELKQGVKKFRKEYEKFKIWWEKDAENDLRNSLNKASTAYKKIARKLEIAAKNTPDRIKRDIKKIHKKFMNSAAQFEKEFKEFVKTSERHYKTIMLATGLAVMNWYNKYFNKKNYQRNKRIGEEIILRRIYFELELQSMQKIAEIHSIEEKIREKEGKLKNLKERSEQAEENYTKLK